MIHKAAILAIVLSGPAILAVQSSAQAVDLSREVEFQISSQRLADAMLEFSDQSGVQVISSGNDVVGITTTGLKGKHSVSDGLRVLLRGTGLSFNIVNDHTITIHTPRSENTAYEGGDDVQLRLAQEGSAQASATPQKSQTAESKKQSDATADASGEKIQEIVVTAQKREERLQDVPISITVLGGKDLDRSSDRGVADALNRVPGVISAVANNNARNSASIGGVVVVRGIMPAAGTSTTGYYLDTIPFGYVGDVFNSSNAPDPSAYDLERVEVLRGPQGTLYGANSLNGVVRVLTKDADLNRFELKGRGSVSSTAAGGENYRGDAAVNVPLIEGKLAARAVVGYQDWSGWIDKPFKKDANDVKSGSYRLKINARPTEKFSAGLSAWVSHTDVGAPPTAADGRSTISQYDEPGKVDYEAYGFKLGYDFSAFTVTSMTSYVDYQAHNRLDYTPFVPAETTLLTFNDTRMWSEEVLLNSTREGPWRWTLGGIYRDATDHVYQFRSLYPSGPPGAQLGVESKSTAIFGELTRAFMDGRFELTGGLRYFEDKKRNWETSRSNLINGTTSSTTGLFALAPEVHAQYTKTTPRIVLTWHPNTQASIYASYAEGFRSGVNQFPIVSAAAAPGQFPSAQPDHLKSYELGTKGSAWGGRFNFDSAVYYLDWKGVQQLITYILSTSPFLANGAMVNAGSVSGPGAEIGVSVEAIDGLTLGTNLSWNDLEINENVYQLGALLYTKGQRLTMSPEYTASVSADYAFPLGASGRKGRLTVSGNYLPKMIADRGAGTLAPVLVSSDPMRMVRASFAVESQGRWTASLYGDNLTDDKAFSYDRFSPRWNASIRPRTIGLQVEFHY